MADYISGQDTVVSEGFDGVSSDPVVAKLAGGRWVVAWTSIPEVSSFDVYQQVFDTSGEAFGEPSRVNATVASQQHQPSIVALSNGGYVVIWASNGQDGSEWGVYMRQFNAAGQAQTGETLVNTTTQNVQYLPSITELDNGNLVATWFSNAGGTYAFYQQVFTSTFTKVGGETLLSTSVIDGMDAAQVTALDDNGWIVTWAGSEGGDNPDRIYQTHFSADGTVIDDELAIIDLEGQTVSDFSVAATSGGGWVVTWTGPEGDGADTGIYLQRYSSTGQAIGSSQHVNTATADGQSNAAIAVLEDGGWVVTWQSIVSGSGTDIFQQRYSASGEKVGEETRVNSTTANDQTDPTIASLADGGWVVSWVDQNDTVRQRIFSAGVVSSDTEIDVAAGATHTLTLDDFPHGGLDLASIIITGLPASGSLKLDGVAVKEDQEIAIADIGDLTWDSSAISGTANVTGLHYRLVDIGGRASAEVYDLDFDPTFKPTATGKTITIKEDAAFNFSESSFGFADADGDTLKSVTIVAGPAKGTLTFNGQPLSNNVISVNDLSKLRYVPVTHASGQDYAALTFRVTDISDAISDETSVINFNVTAVNDAPIAVDDTGKLLEGTTGMFRVLANDTDVDSKTLLLSKASVLTSNAKVTIRDGALNVLYTGKDLDPGATADIRISYTVSDGSLKDTGLLTVKVTGLREPGDDIFGTSAANKLDGTNVAERIDGLGGNDIIKGLAGNDRLYGNTGNDTLYGGSGNDLLYGGTGKDRLAGEMGNDTLTGGAGADRFVFATGHGKDVITDFDTSGSDHDFLDLGDVKGVTSFKALSKLMAQKGGNVLIDLPGADQIILKNIDLGDLGKEHFLF